MMMIEQFLIIVACKFTISFFTFRKFKLLYLYIKNQQKYFHNFKLLEMDLNILHINSWPNFANLMIQESKIELSSPYIN